MSVLCEQEDMVIGACSGLYANAVVRRRFAEAERWFQQGMDYFAGRDIGLGAFALSGLRGLHRLHEGRWREAVALAEEGSEAPLAFFRVPPLVVLGTVRAARAEAAFLAGDLERARVEARAGLEAGAGRANPWLLGELACWRWCGGGPEPAPDGIAEPFANELYFVDRSGTANDFAVLTETVYLTVFGASRTYQLRWRSGKPKDFLPVPGAS